MDEWRETKSSYFRELERQQRGLAQDASSDAIRDVHLEFAERYRQKAEQLEDEERRRAADPG